MVVYYRYVVQIMQLLSLLWEKNAKTSTIPLMDVQKHYGAIHL